jgi:hypothetical protein
MGTNMSLWGKNDTIQSKVLGIKYLYSDKIILSIGKENKK